MPHELVDGQLHLHMGSLRHVAVPVAQVARVLRQVDAALLARPGTRKLVPLAFPNRIIELVEPLPGRRAIRALAIRLDDPADFDSALAGLELLEWWQSFMEIPCVAIGGITPANCGPLVRAGADFIAVSGAVWNGDEAANIRALAEAIAAA